MLVNTHKKSTIKQRTKTPFREFGQKGALYKGDLGGKKHIMGN